MKSATRAGCDSTRFRLTNLARTMVDLASVLDDGWLRAAFHSAVRQSKANVGWISRVLTAKFAQTMGSTAEVGTHEAS